MKRTIYHFVCDLHPRKRRCPQECLERARHKAKAQDLAIGLVYEQICNFPSGGRF